MGDGGWEYGDTSRQEAGLQFFQRRAGGKLHFRLVIFLRVVVTREVQLLCAGAEGGGGG